MSLSRREFFQNAGKALALGSATVVLVRCGQSPSSLLEFAIKDIPSLVENSSLRGDILTVEQIKAGDDVLLYIRESSHKHEFVVTRDHLALLRKGETVKIVTEEVYNHTHTMVLIPT